MVLSSVVKRNKYWQLLDKRKKLKWINLIQLLTASKETISFHFCSHCMVSTLPPVFIKSRDIFVEKALKKPTFAIKPHFTLTLQDTRVIAWRLQQIPKGLITAIKAQLMGKVSKWECFIKDIRQCEGQHAPSHCISSSSVATAEYGWPRSMLMAHSVVWTWQYFLFLPLFYFSELSYLFWLCDSYSGTKTLSKNSRSTHLQLSTPRCI